MSKKMSRETARDLADVMRAFSRTKTVQAKVLTAPTDGSGKFSALVSTFGPPPDTQGDVIDRHAFDRTITEAMVNHPGSLWGVWYEHGYSDPQNVIGVINAAAATDQGLIVVGTLSIDRSTKALEVYHALLDDRLREWSIGYGITSEHTDIWQGQQVQVLTEVELLEISCVHKGANRLTRTLDIKTADTKPVVNRQALKDLVTAGKAMLGEKARPRLSDGVGDAIMVSLAQAHLVFDHGMAEDEVLAMSFDKMRTVHLSEHQRGADHEHDGMTTEGETSAKPGPNDPKRYAKMLDDILGSWVTEEHYRGGGRPTGHDEIKAINAELARLDPDTKKIRSDISDEGLVDKFVREDRELRARENAEAERLARLDRDLEERASHRGPIPDFDARFAVASHTVEYESGPTDARQVSGSPREEFRVAFLPGRMSPVEGEEADE